MDPLLESLVAVGIISSDVAESADRVLSLENLHLWSDEMLTGTMSEALRSQQDRLLTLLREAGYAPTDRDLDTFWAREDDRLWDTITDTFSDIVAERAALVEITAGANNIWELVNARVSSWVSTHYTSASLADVGSVPNLNLTSRHRVAAAFEDWTRGDLQQIDDGGIFDLVAVLEPTFGPVRAEAIATTEVTRIFARVAEEEARTNELIHGFIWQTAADDVVCEICGPMHGQRRTIGDPFIHPNLGEITVPAHVRCRCDLAPYTELTEGLSVPEDTYEYEEQQA